MSDSIKDMVRHYEQNVFNYGHPRSVGLFPIPEYPEYESGRGMWSEALAAILTTLRYLAPATLLTLFWGQQSFLFRLLKSIDNALRAIVFSSDEQKQSALQWIAETGNVRVESLDTIWRHGWILCGVLDGALPGACAGHPPTRLSLKHAQAIADNYLGVEPVFSRQELESNDSLSKHQEWKLANYIDRIREALSKVTPPASKPVPQKPAPETTQFTLDYVARGSGLNAAQVNNSMHFKIYPTSQQCLDPGEITILIRGPKDTYGMTVLPPILGKAQLIRQKLLRKETKPNYTESALPLTQGATYLRSYGKNDMNKLYYIPKSKYDIEIEEETREDHVKISYVVQYEGKYEISITSRGQNIVGSPFSMTASKNIVDILERKSFCLEDGEEIDIVDVKTDRKVVLRIVDFVTEKMLLRENGSLEKITDEEAKLLMSAEEVFDTDSSFDSTYDDTVNNSSSTDEVTSVKFKKTAYKVIQMNRVCKIIRELTSKAKQKYTNIERTYIRARNQPDIPDVVNSTLNEPNINTFWPDKRDKIIVAENISVNLRTEVSKSIDCDKAKKASMEIIDFPVCKPIVTNIAESLQKYETLEQQIESDLTEIPISSSNPFLNDLIEQSYAIEKDLGSFVKTEYETNNSQIEETQDPRIKITIEETQDIDISTSGNPFLELGKSLERPKTPVLKIITGEIENRDDSVYVDPKTAQIVEETLGNEFLNPFFLHHHEPKIQDEPVTDFIIGAPVSLPPIIRAQTPDPAMDSILITNMKNDNETVTKHNDEKHTTNNDTPSAYSTPIHVNISKIKSEVSSAFQSLDSNDSDNVEILSLSTASDNQEQSDIDRELTPKKDMWDSAYVSIDDTNSSPDTNNNNDNLAICDSSSKYKVSPFDDKHIFANMGPAERELWQTCSELKQNIPQICEETKPNKWEAKRITFTPIIEENDRSISSGLKEIKKLDKSNSMQTESDPVTVAFAEINTLYNDYFTTSETTPTKEQKDKDIGEAINTIEDKSVNSASEISDVKRHAAIHEGKISEVQANVTESVSVSQPLHNPTSQIAPAKTTATEVHFGDKSHTNIVLEKKQYWDEKIREIESKTEEIKTQQRRRRLSSKHLRQNDSLTKRRGKEIAKNFVNENRKSKTDPSEVKEIFSAKSPLSSPQNEHSDVKLVDKWKKYWDSKLELKDEPETTCFRTKSTKTKSDTNLSQHQHQSHETSMSKTHESQSDIIEEYKDTTQYATKKNMPVKQELPEEMFKAFETSPKRFFGTSRKQILSKIDTFLGKPSTVDESSTDVTGASRDTGLVSSRISMFHNISNTEPQQWNRRKCQSMQNIFQRKDSEKTLDTTDKIDDKIEEPLAKLDGTKTNVENIQSSSVKTLQEKRARFTQNGHSKTVHELPIENKTEQVNSQVSQPKFTQNGHSKTVPEIQIEKTDEVKTQTPQPIVKNVIKVYNKQSHSQKYKPKSILRKSSISKSEMDIFNKTVSQQYDDDLDKHKSYDELPKINVKNFISLYESVSKTDLPVPTKKISKPFGTLQNQKEISSSSGAVNTASFPTLNHTTAKERTKSESNTDEMNIDTWTSRVSSQISKFDPTPNKRSPNPILRKNLWTNRSMGSKDSLRQSAESVEITSIEDPKQTTCLSLSDMELEIIEATKAEETKTDEESSTTDYKSRFKSAKNFFKSLEELREDKKPTKLNECELLLKKSTESLEQERTPKRVKKNIKSHSMPSSEISKIWNQLQESQEPEATNSDSQKPVKISEKFNVDDLFTDVMEGKLSRQGSLRGIPHKKAVLETFKSMENITDNLSPYNIAVTQLSDLPLDDKAKTAQTYLSEYPYLPTTDPSKYHSRIDAKASGLISLKDLKNQKPRRNSVPDIRLDAKFTVDL